MIEETREYLLRKLVREFTEKEIAPYDFMMDQKGEFDHEIMKKIGATGLLGCGFDKKYGGADLGKACELFMLEEMSVGSASIALTVDATFLGMNCIDMFGSEKQKEEFLPSLIHGDKLSAFALTEPSGGSDVASITTKAIDEGDGYLINGEKSWITNFSVAETYIVFAKTEPKLGAKGISAFIVDKNTPGLVIGEKEDKMGVRGSDTGSLHFDNMWISKERLLGECNGGFVVAMAILDAARLHISAIGVGLMQHALNIATSYANTRIAFGQAIGRFQAIQFILSDMEIRLYASRCMMRDAVNRKMKGENYTGYAAKLKVYISEATVQTTNDAIQILGGNGYSKEYHVERLLRDAKLIDIGEGASQILRVVIGKNVLRRGVV
jgi:alkylation response protein AidB-like acyl-CoA dehydrogenase